jgi:cellulose synthase/poly-beta-1,6-N-acetylglucosamine synthase-like glycosyltransferase
VANSGSFGVSLVLLIFFLSAAFLLYVLFGYPLLLAFLARRNQKPLRKEPLRETVTVIVPVRDGERWIQAKLESLLAQSYPRDLVKILVVSDGSEDRTEDLVRRFAPDGVELVCLPQGGKAAALNAGIERAESEILFFTDVRQPLSQDALRHLVSCFADPTVGASCGELIILEGKTQEEASVGLYWRYEKWVRRQLNRLGSLLVVTGCIYAIRRELVQPIPTDTLADDAYVPLNVLLRGYRIVFEEQAKAYDHPTGLETEFHRKVRTLAGLYQLILRQPRVLGTANPMWVHFLSYKASRLLLPYALILIAVTSFGLPGPWREILLAAQGVFYGLAALDPRIRESVALKRLSSPARAFVILMVAAVYATSVFFVPAQELWKVK